MVAGRHKPTIRRGWEAYTLGWWLRDIKGILPPLDGGEFRIRESYYTKNGGNKNQVKDVF